MLKKESSVKGAVHQKDSARINKCDFILTQQKKAIGSEFIGPKKTFILALMK